jgi:hypothetical protein
MVFSIKVGELRHRQFRHLAVGLPGQQVSYSAGENILESPAFERRRRPFS